MQTLEKYLIDLMHQHDCVVIPNFGGMVANYTPAFLDAKNQVLAPPSKGFVFNRFLQHNDGLLVHEISKQENVSYENALAMLEEEVCAIQRTIASFGRFEFGSIGSFYKDAASFIKFEAKKSNYLMSSFGLPIVKAFQIEQLIVKEQEAISLVEESLVDEVKTKTPKGKVIAIQEPVIHKSRKSSNAKWWVAAALIPLGFYSAWLPLKTDLFKQGGNFQYSDLNPFTYSKTAPLYKYNQVFFSSVDTTSKVDFTPLELLNPVDFPKEEIIIEAETTFVDVTAPVPNAVVNNKEVNNYYLIGGCFSDENNAINFVNELKSQGFNASLVDVNQGLHRVAFGNYASKDEAAKAKNEITASGNYSAWVLKK